MPTQEDPNAAFLQQMQAVEQESNPDAIPEAEPEVTLEVEGDDQDGVIVDALKGLVSGPLSAVENLGDSLGSAAEAVGIPGGPIVFDETLRDSDDSTWTWLTKQEAIQRGAADPVFGLPDRDDNIMGKRSTLVGGATHGIAQFMTSFLVTRGLTGGSAGTAGTLAQSSLAESFGFNPWEDRLSDFLQDNAGLRDPVTSYLAADPTDSEAEGRLKLALEGLAVGVPIEAAVRMFRGIKEARVAQDMDEAERVLQETAAELEQMRQAGGEAEVEVREGTANSSMPERPDVDTDALRAELERQAEHGNINGSWLRSDVFNYSKMQTDDGIKNAIDVTAELMGDQLYRLTQKGTKPLSQMYAEGMRELGDLTGASTEQLMGRLQAVAESAKDQAAWMLAGKTMIQTLARSVQELALKADNKVATDDELVEFAKRFGMLQDTIGYVKTIQQEGARTTVAGRVKTRDVTTTDSGLEAAGEVGDAETTERLIEALGGREALGNTVSRILGVGDDPTAIAKLAQKEGTGTRILRIANEYYINSLLSGPTTHVVNFASNTVRAVAVPAERFIGSAVSADLSQAGEAGMHLLYMLNSIPEAVRLGSRAFSLADNVLDPNMKQMEVDMASGGLVSSQRGAISMEGEGVLPALVNGLGAVTRFPSRLLLTSDEMFKQIQYRGYLRAKLMKQAHEQPGLADDAARQQWVKDQFEAGFDQYGRGVDTEALEMAREATFTRDLKSPDRASATKLAASLQDVANKHPSVRQFVPFIRTPWNLISDVAIRTPVLQNFSMEFNKQLVSSNPRVRNLARGKMASGWALWSSAVMYASQGRITGGGPADPDARKNLMKSGWRPYSIITVDEATGQNKYISIRRGDPFGTFFSLAADYSEMSQNMPTKDGESLFAHGLMATLKTMTSKTFLQGMYNVMGAMQQPERQLQSALGAWIAGYAPNIVRDAPRITDDLGVTQDAGDATLREAHYVFDRFKAKIPGWSDEVPARINWLTGEKQLQDRGDYLGLSSPFTTSTDKQGLFWDEWRKLQPSFEAPARMVSQGDFTYTWTKDEYEKYLGLIHQPTSSMKPLKERLEEVMRSPAYRNTPVLSPREERANPDSRTALLSKEIGRYRKAAQRQMEKTSDDYAAFMKQVDQFRRTVRGRSSDEVSSKAQTLLQQLEPLGAPDRGF